MLFFYYYYFSFGISVCEDRDTLIYNSNYV